MTARSAATIASLVVVTALGGCTNFFEVPSRHRSRRRWTCLRSAACSIAGFISGGTDDVDANLETVRLLRSQLRSKSGLRVIEADVLPLAELAADKVKTGAAPAEPPLPASGGATDGLSPVPQLPAAAPTATPGAPAAPGAASPGESRIRNAKDLEKYQSIFADVAFWKKIGEEYQNPLIVTGTVLFIPQQTAGFVTRNHETYDQLGRRVVVPQRLYMERKGFDLRRSSSSSTGGPARRSTPKHSTRRSSTARSRTRPRFRRTSS